ncbi:alpha/beta hydrolase [Novosphingobium sp. Gsoil 351]|uniref:alpha/beta hydrolase n=1 Tax=Novosphingobium sp. Gsoil 351 TaxID=2675225 RepID=UPI0018A826F3|nr:alpha/beta hydrolase [Novosphingobium sp. Gsoil 351]
MAKGRFFGCDDPQGLAVHFHGGGWVLGSIHNQDDILTQLSQQCSFDIITLDYPLAPEAGLAEIIAWSQMALIAITRTHSERPIVIIGESAGAHLALSALLAIRDHAGLPDNIRALSLFYGIFDLSMTASQRSWGPTFLGLSTPWLEYFYELALPTMGLEERRAPSISPLYADLSGLPPALLSVGTLDPLIDDSKLLHAKWLEAGNIGQLDVYPEAPHGFNHSETAMAGHANRASSEFLLKYL